MTGLLGSGGASTGGETKPTAGSATGGSVAASLPRDPCPSDVPTEGDDCDLLARTCSYGDDPRGPRCRQQAACTAEGWVVGTPECEPLPSDTCAPSLDGVNATPCSVEGAICVDETTRCVCTPCVEEGIQLCEGGMCQGETLLNCTGSETAWFCSATEGTTPSPPNLGTECTMGSIEYLDTECSRQVPMLCLQGLWLAWEGTRFGACNENLIEPGELCPATPPEALSACPPELSTNEYVGCNYGCDTFNCAGGTWAQARLGNCP